MRVREERKSENLRVRDELGISWSLGSVVQGKGKRASGVGDSMGEETEERSRAYTFVSSLIYIKTRGLMELFPPRLRNLWKYWELRVLVLLSLILQIILIIFGNRRKYTSKIWIRIGLWCAYLMADWVVTVALGVISNNLGDTAKSIGKDGSPIDNIQLTAFWAPFLLLHLGGPNTITAYSMEDNELWLRHLLRLGVQTGVALYIFLTAWMGSQISILSILIFCAGTIKYGERTWVLRSASNEQFRESMLTPPNIGPNYSKFMREYTLKQFEGFHVIADKVIEAQVVNLPSVENNSIRDATELVIANDLINIFKRLFVDLILGFDDKDYTVNLCSKIILGIKLLRGGAVLEKYSNLRLDCHLGLESVKVQFDQSFLIWHIATDLFYHLDYKTEAPLCQMGHARAKLVVK
ncbi:hypothetical protein CMV_013320 [Castanea mollissima]|uniref:DUF4220 domain-containing protein n=1 Tax=Castanea mollissima TaxID=60419 RepID=A0A8J4VIC7_9ROSI|nr:hypothetical protein CMV_013320 [Castanea mollissima]